MTEKKELNPSKILIEWVNVTKPSTEKWSLGAHRVQKHKQKNRK